MESKEEAAVERQKLVPDDTENEPDDEQMAPTPNIIIIGGSGGGGGGGVGGSGVGGGCASASASSALPKNVTQTPISPVLSHKIFSSGETSRTQDSSNCSVGRGGGNSESCGGVSGGACGVHSTTRLIYVNEQRSSGKQLDAKQQQQADYKAKARRIQRDDGGESGTPPRTPPSQHRAQLHTSHHQQAPTPTAQHAHTSHAPHNTPPNINTITTTTTTTVPILHAIPSTSTHAQTSSSVVTTSAKHETAAGGAGVSGGGGGGNVTFDQRQLKHHSFVSEVPDVRHMERALLGLLEDFHLGKLKAFGSGCTMDQMTDIREQQESLAKLHFELGAGGDPLNSGGNAGSNTGLNAQENMTQLVAKLENLSVSIERLHSSNSNL